MGRVTLSSDISPARHHILTKINISICCAQDNGLADIEIMWRLLLCEEETACVTCPVRPVNPYESFLAASQSLECESM